MIGNDIVDLAQARRESNWRRKGFLDKLFTLAEQRLIRNADDPDALVWTLWSMKESAYKLVVQETGQRFFAPHKLICRIVRTDATSIAGYVSYQKTYSTLSTLTDRYVASVAFPVVSHLLFNQVVIPFEQADYQHHRTTIRKRIKQFYATRFSISEDRIDIHSDELGIPSLIVRDPSGNSSSQVISLSHHGYYGAFALTQKSDEVLKRFCTAALSCSNPILSYECSYY
ncbi:4'-phosphopantetheinyl transferase family protein [Spirosoma koreense]